MKQSGIITIAANLRLSLNTLFARIRSVFSPRESDLTRSHAISKNFFLHIHDSKIHLYSLRPGFTLGLGVIAFCLFTILAVTGMMLMIYYVPSVGQAYQSIQDIIFVVSGGRFIRNMHRWSAHGLVAIVILHMLRVFFTGAYQDSRRVTWIFGLVLLLSVMLSSFSGYLMPWDQLAFWAVTIAANIASSTKELTDFIGITGYIDPGNLTKLILFGDTEIGQAALTRFYLLHVVFLPFTIFMVTGLHFWRIRKSSGLALPANADEIVATKYKIPPDQAKVKNAFTIWSWPTLLWTELALFMLSLMVILTVAYFVDAPLRDIANPALPENPAKSPWYFLGVQELVSYSAFSGGVMIPLLVLVALFLIPFLDREDKLTGVWFAGTEGKKVVIYSSIFALVISISIMSILGFSGWSARWPFYLSIFVNPGTLLALSYFLWALYILRTRKSTRMSAIALVTCIIWGFILITGTGIWLRGPNWELML